MLTSVFSSLGTALTLLACLTIASGLPAPSGSGCAEIEVRKEWRDLAPEDRTGYIQAVKCLMKTPPREPGGRARNRFEEFQATHILLTGRIHRVGHFLPWHRYQGTLYRRALRDECGYKGPGTFWDWSRDADSDKPLAESPIFDAETGFGGDGVPNTYTIPDDPQGLSGIDRPYVYVGCVRDGPFRDTEYTVRLGPGRLETDHCLVRGINESWRPGMLSSNVEDQLSRPTFEEFRTVIDSVVNGIHGIGHQVVGGEMTNLHSAGADPLFYMHHANLDRLWWKWQCMDLERRTYAISGPTTVNGTDTISLDFVMDFPALASNITVREVMDSTSRSGCFVYDY